MSSIRALLCLFCVIALVLPLPAQISQPTAVQIIVSDAQALKAAQQSLSAMGYVTGPLSLQASGTIHSPDQEDGTFEIVAANPRTYRTITTRGSGSYVYLMNDGIGAVTFGGKTRHIGGSEVMSARCPFFPFYSFIGETSRPDVVVEPLKSNSIDGNPTYTLRTTVKDVSNPDIPLQSVSEMEVDAKSFLPLKLRMQVIHSDNIEIISHLEYSFADYRREGSLVLPHEITLSVDGTVIYTVRLTAFQFNVATDLTVTLQ